MYQLLGITKVEFKTIEQVLLEAIHPDDMLQLYQAKEEALLQGKKVDVEHRIVRPDNSIRFVHTIGEVSFDKERNPVLFSGTMQDITKRKQEELQMQQLNADLEKRAEELKASNTELEHFAYVASHDLQEPLRMVTSFLALLKKRHQNEFDETSEKFIQFAVDGAERMKGLIQDLLKYSRVGSANEPFTSVDLNTVISDIRQVYAQALTENAGVLMAGNLPVVSGHKVQLYQLFQNLVGNALKYHSAKCPIIEIGCSEKEEEWEFSVKDNGMGIDPRYFDKIFIIFQRLHNKNEYTGTGIGLAICKKIVERHDGRIWVDSHSGHGSTFYFTLRKMEHDAGNTDFTG